MKTKKVVIGTMAAAILSLTLNALPLTFAAGETVQISVGSQEVAPGEEFSVNVEMKNIPAKGIQACDFAVKYDNSLITVTSVTVGSLISSGVGSADSTSSVPNFESYIIDASGKVNLVWSTSATDSKYWLNGSGVMCTIKGKALSTAPDGSKADLQVVATSRAASPSSSAQNSKITAGYINGSEVVKYDVTTVDGVISIGVPVTTTTTTTQPTTTSTTATTKSESSTTTTTTQPTTTTSTTTTSATTTSKTTIATRTTASRTTQSTTSTTSKTYTTTSKTTTSTSKTTTTSKQTTTSTTTIATRTTASRTTASTSKSTTTTSKTTTKQTTTSTTTIATRTTASRTTASTTSATTTAKTTVPTQSTTSKSTTKQTTTTQRVTTTQAADPSKILYGDANCDGIVNISDAVAVMSYVSNPTAYPLSAQGLANADVYNRGDSISNMDALSIQKFMAQILTKLPES